MNYLETVQYFLQLLFRSFQCFCQDCHIVPPSLSSSSTKITLSYAASKLSIGQTTSCFYKTSSAHALTSKLGSAATWHVTAPSTGLAIHAILWPTLFFVVGFVGVFFSCIYSYKSQQKIIQSVDFYMSVSGISNRVV